MSPERSPLIEELSKLRQDARDAQRQQEKANRRQAQANAGHHAAMQQAAWEQTAAARATQTVVAEQLDSQRHFQYTMWLQTKAGQAFRAWEPNANWYIKAMQQCGTAWEEAWRLASETRLGPPPQPRLSALFVGSMLKVLAALPAFLFVVGLLSTLAFNPSTAGNYIILAATGIGAVILFVAGLKVGKLEYSEVVKARQDRITTFGFDACNPSALPRWHDGSRPEWPHIAQVLDNAFTQLPSSLPVVDHLPKTANRSPRWPAEAGRALEQIDQAVG
jgi:hypothetical protein